MEDNKKPPTDDAKEFFEGKPTSRIMDEVKENLEHAKAEADAVSEAINVSTVESAGIMVDDQGNTWTIPEKDEVDVHYVSKFFLPKKDPRFDYQFVRKEEITEMMGDQWVPATRAEVGIADFKLAEDEYGDALDRYHTIGTMICVKKPKILVERTRKALKRICDAAVAATEPQPVDDEHKKARESAGPKLRRYSQDRHTIVVNARNPANEQNTAAED